MEPSPPPTRRPLSRRRKIQFITIILFGCCLLFFGLGEVTVRILSRSTKFATGEFTSLPGVPFKIRPHFEGMNSEGFRDVERPFAKPPGVYRVLFLGDSFVWGVVDREKNFPALIEAKLNALSPSKRIEIINLGVPSYGPEESLALWQNYAIRYQPDAVVYGFFYGNDLTDDNPLAYRRALLGELAVIRRDSLFDQSLFLVYLRTKWRLLVYNLTHRGAAQAQPMTPAEVKHLAEGELAFYDPARAYATKPLLDHLAGILLRMRDFATAQKTPLLVMRYPSQLTVDPPTTRSVIGLSYDQYDMRQLNRQMDGVLNGIGIAHADITEQIAEAEKHEQLYRWPNDTHWNEKGTAVAAEAMTPIIRTFLERDGLTFGKKPD